MEKPENAGFRLFSFWSLGQDLVRGQPPKLEEYWKPNTKPNTKHHNQCEFQIWTHSLAKMIQLQASFL